MFENIFDVVMRAVREWLPKKRYPKEIGYRDDLYEFLRNKIEHREEGNIFGLSTSAKYFVQKESGRYLADIAVINSEKIGIELKYNFERKSQRNRLVGQVKEYFREYSYVVIVLCGYVDTQQFDALQRDLKEYVESSGFSFGESQKIVKIVSKSKTKASKKKKITTRKTKKKTASFRKQKTKPKRATRKKKTKPKRTKTTTKRSKTKRRKR